MPEALAPAQPAVAPVAAPAPAPAAPAAKAPIVKGRFELPPDPAPKAPAPVAAPAEAPKADANTSEPEATEAEPEAKPEPEVTPEQEAKRAARRAQNKLEKAFRQRAEAQARADLLEKQVNELRQQAPQPGFKKPGEPTLEQYDYDPEKYAQAKADFARKAAEQELTAKQLHERQRANHQRLVSEWETKVDKSADKYEDFDTVVGELTPNSPFVAAIMKVPNGPDVAYNLGKNPAEAERIAKLEPLEQIVEITLLAARLSAEPVKAKAPSKAPAPIAPLTGTTPVATNVPTEADGTKEWMRKRQKQVHGRS